jgi:hypothetical protein
MDVDTDLQIWLERRSEGGQTLIIPYTRSDDDAQFSFRITAVCKGQAGTSRIAQQGRIAIVAGQPTPLAQLNMGNLEHKTCEVEIAVNRDGRAAAVRVFSIGC